MTLLTSPGAGSGTPVATVSVVGSGAVAVVPDVARLRVAASAGAESVAAATSLLGESMGSLLAAARGVVEERHVASTGLQVWPRHDGNGTRTGFEANQQVHVLCPTLEVASALIADLAGAVGDGLRVEGLDLEVSDTSQALLEARESAFVDARARAEHLAALSGRELGEVLSVTEGDGAMAVAPVALRAEMASMPLAAGEREVRSSLRVTWLLV